jgi:hypothetical protein
MCVTPALGNAELNASEVGKWGHHNRPARALKALRKLKTFLPQAFSLFQRVIIAQACQSKTKSQLL